MASQLASSIASEGGSEPNVDPMLRIRVENLTRVAELHVAQATGITLPSNTSVEAVSRAVWTERTVADYRPFFERFAEALGSAMTDSTDTGDPASPPGADPFGALFNQLFSSIGPMLVSASAGSMIGHLGQRALGQYDLPIPRPTPSVLVVPSAISAIADEWDIALDDLLLWVLVHELTAHSVLSTPHVRARLDALLLDFAAAFRPNADAIAERFSSIGSVTDLSQLQELSESLSDPDALLSIMRSPAHDLLLPQFQALLAAVLGYVSHTVTQICDPLLDTSDPLSERFRQRWLDTAPADRLMERLLGVEVTESTLDRGDAFIAGVVARSGDDGLERLWADELDLPTAAEIDAPGLWLARIGIDGDLGETDFEVPDDLSGLDDA